MPEKNSKQPDVAELLEKLLIVQLAAKGVPQADIRKIVGCDIRRVNWIARHLKKVKVRDADS